jgi:hypothetical protein
MGDPTPTYLSYLIRLWEADVDGRKVWRASAESPHTGERHAFADLSLLVGFLEEQTFYRSQETEASESGIEVASGKAGADRQLDKH